MSDPVLSLRAVTKTYGAPASETHVLKGVDLQLAAGEVVALVAPSGAGKSTLLHIAGLLDTASSGTLSHCGRETHTASENARTAARLHQIGFIYQFHHLLPEFSAVENVALPQRVAGVSKTDAEKRAVNLLTQVGLEHRLTHRPAALSGGEQQRVAFCRAFANDPNLILADEPTGNLDPETSARVFETLIALVRNTGGSPGRAALIATHNHELAARMDRIVYLENGRITQS